MDLHITAVVGLRLSFTESISSSKVLRMDGLIDSLSDSEPITFPGSQVNWQDTSELCHSSSKQAIDIQVQELPISLLLAMVSWPHDKWENYRIISVALLNM